MADSVGWGSEEKYLGYLRALEGSPTVNGNERMGIEVGAYASNTIWGMSAQVVRWSNKDCL